MEKNIGVIYFSNNELILLDVAYGISSLKKVTSKVAAYNIQNSTFDSTIDLITSSEIKIIVCFLSYDCYDMLIKTCNSLKEKMNDITIVACHSLATSLYSQILTEIQTIDIVVIGEYENTLYEVCQCIVRQKNYYDCRGIAYRLQNKIIKTAPRDLMRIEDISYPAREFFDTNSRYFHVYGSRGCEGHCSFCDRKSLYPNSVNINVRSRSIPDIVNEVDELVNSYNCKFISFSDPTFTSSFDAINRLELLYENLRSKNYWVQFTINMRAELINEHVIECLVKLKTVGLGKIFIGIESFNIEDLKLFGKVANIEDIKRCVTLLKNFEYSLKDDYQMKVEYGFINFQPYSTLESLHNNIKLLKRYGII